jgi:hypothetical protein
MYTVIGSMRYHCLTNIYIYIIFIMYAQTRTPEKLKIFRSIHWSALVSPQHSPSNVHLWVTDSVPSHVRCICTTVKDNMICVYSYIIQLITLQYFVFDLY